MFHPTIIDYKALKGMAPTHVSDQYILCEPDFLDTNLFEILRQ